MAMNQPLSVLPANLWPPPETSDEILDEIHTFREAYAAQFDYDIARMFEDLQEREKRNPARQADLLPVEPKHSL